MLATGELGLDGDLATVPEASKLFLKDIIKFQLFQLYQGLSYCSYGSESESISDSPWVKASLIFFLSGLGYIHQGKLNIL